MKPVLVDIGIACSGMQSPKWWGPNFAHIIREVDEGHIMVNKIMSVSSALPDFNKTEAVGEPISTDYAPAEYKRRNDLTDANRLRIARNFMDSKAEWLFFIDDDTVFPEGTIHKLLSRKKEFIGGVYVNTNPPYNPIAYVHAEDGVGYNPIYDFPPGSLIQVDSIGMGCTLIHKSVFKKIVDGHSIFARPNGSIMAIKNSYIFEGVQPTHYIDKPDIFYSNGWIFMKTKELSEEDNRLWPFFVMEYGRTEDHHFCELAENVGIKPWVDTTIWCEHIKPFGYGKKFYRDAKNERDGL